MARKRLSAWTVHRQSRLESHFSEAMSGLRCRLFRDVGCGAGDDQAYVSGPPTKTSDDRGAKTSSGVRDASGRCRKPDRIEASVERAGNSQDANAAGDGPGWPPVTAPMRADCSLRQRASRRRRRMRP